MPFVKSKPPLPTRRLSFLRAAVLSAISALNHGCIMPIPSLQLQKKPAICTEAEGLVTELSHTRFVTDNTVIVSKIWIAGFWLCSQVQHVTVANQETIVEIEHLASAGWKRGGQPFSCRCSQNVMHCQKETCWTCLFKESIPAIPFWNSKHPTYQKLEVPESRSTFRHLCIKWWHHAHPFVAAAEKDCVMQRSRGFGHGVVVQKINTIYWLSDCALSCAMRLLQTSEQLSRLRF